MKAAGVRFRRAGKVYPFNPGDLEVKRNQKVIVDTSWGPEMGTVIYVEEDHPEEKEMRKIIRMATAQDLEMAGRNREKEPAAFRICKEKIEKRGLAMNLVAVEYTFDGSKILFYFTADNRIDFRELVKDLASVFHTRIELRQIGVRDETKLIGGLGICGRELCCHSYLSEFAPVSIRMAKEQNLSLNPTKISGTCGRLMCCLKNEEETYEYLNSRIPAEGDTVTAKNGNIKGVVQSTDVLRQTVKVLFTAEDGSAELKEFKADDLRFTPRHHGRRRMTDKEKQEARELEALENEDRRSRSRLD
ncbi:MAG: stage 0 sporulation family protein [Lachnospiraceae bacterium]|nr:stage 0 sporulation family protein [Lachnospiraceae bacterium]